MAPDNPDEPGMSSPRRSGRTAGKTPAAAAGKEKEKEKETGATATGNGNGTPRSKPARPEGKLPSLYKVFKKGAGDSIAETFWPGFTGFTEMMKVTEYLSVNHNHVVVPINSKGNCMWDTIRALMWIYDEWTMVHLRREVVMFILDHIDILLKDLIQCLIGIYGCPVITPEEYERKRLEGTLTEMDKTDRNLPGPQSICSYLENLLTPGFWGDYFVLSVVCRIYMITLSVIREDSLLPTHYYHKGPWWVADLKLLWVGHVHYQGIGEFLIIIYFSALKRFAFRSRT